MSFATQSFPTGRETFLRQPQPTAGHRHDLTNNRTEKEMDSSEVILPDAGEAAVMLRGAIAQMEFARNYTLELLNTIPPDRWYEIPESLPTNVAWQVGHLTVSQYGLLMFRMRGRQPDDLTLIPGKFRKAYSRGSTPSPDPDKQPSVDDLLQRLGEVYRIGMSVIGQIDPAVLLEPVDMPYATFPIKLGAILFCPLHEHIHAGQIGLVRRGLGLEPVR